MNRNTPDHPCGWRLLYRGFRRAHAKDLCITGFFQSTGNGTALSYALYGRLVSMPSRAT
jgi:hypothetical protein